MEKGSGKRQEQDRSVAKVAEKKEEYTMKKEKKHKHDIQGHSERTYKARTHKKAPVQQDPGDTDKGFHLVLYLPLFTLLFAPQGGAWFSFLFRKKKKMGMAEKLLLSPWQKWKKYQRVPWKAFLHGLLFVVVITQVKLSPLPDTIPHPVPNRCSNRSCCIILRVPSMYGHHTMPLMQFLSGMSKQTKQKVLFLKQIIIFI